VLSHHVFQRFQWPCLISHQIISRSLTSAIGCAAPAAWEATEMVRINALALPSGKRLHNYGKSPFLMGKLNYFSGHFQ
jgi:hypothetical protein